MPRRIRSRPCSNWLAVVVVRKAEAIEDELRAHVRAHADRGAISRWAVPVGVRFVESIDKTSVGKVDKKLLRHKYA